MKNNRKTLLTGICLIPSSGGVPKTMRKFSEALNAQVVSFTHPEWLNKEGSAFEGIEHILTVPGLLGKYYTWTPKRRLASAERLAANADLITCHVMLRYHAHWVRKMAKRHSIPYWFIPHGQLDPYVYTYRSFIKKAWYQIFGKQLLREAAHVIYSTEQERKKAQWLYKGDNTRVVHWPVNLIPTEEKPEARVSLRGKIGAQPESKVLVYLGRLHSMKRPLETIQAFCRATVNDSNSHLVVVGMEHGISFEECRKVAAKMDKTKQVHILGPVFGQEKENLLLGSDAYISLSLRENFGHTAAESLAAGVPVILSIGNDLSQELKPYQCGWFLQSASEDEAVNAIRDCLDIDHGRMEEMGIRGRSFIEKECSFDGFRAALVALREEACCTG